MLIVYLKPAIDLIEDLYYRRRLLTFIIIIDGEKGFKIEKML